MLKHLNISAVQIMPIYCKYSRIIRTYFEVRDELFNMSYSQNKLATFSQSHASEVLKFNLL
jgi:hypothetical protein